MLNEESSSMVQEESSLFNYPSDIKDAMRLVSGYLRSNGKTSLRLKREMEAAKIDVEHWKTAKNSISKKFVTQLSKFLNIAVSPKQGL